jgi:hypothetical protein
VCVCVDQVYRDWGYVENSRKPIVWRELRPFSREDWRRCQSRRAAFGNNLTHHRRHDRLSAKFTADGCDAILAANVIRAVQMTVTNTCRWRKVYGVWSRDSVVT